MNTSTDAGQRALIERLRDLLAKVDSPNGHDWKFPLRVVPSDGKPIIASSRGGNLFRGYIGTWQEADLIVETLNALPTLLAAFASPVTPAAAVCASCGFPWGADPVRHAEFCDNRTPAAATIPGGEREGVKCPGDRCYSVSTPEGMAKDLTEWVRRAMRFIDLCDADASGYDDLHEDAERMTVDGYMLFGANVTFDQWCLADLEHRHLAALSPKPISDAEHEAIDRAIRKTEYKYFGDYEMSDDQREAVDQLVLTAQRYTALTSTGEASDEVLADAGGADGFVPRIGDQKLGARTSDGERICAHGHIIAEGQALYWPANPSSQYDDSDPYCFEHAIERAEERGYILPANPVPGDAGGD